MGTVISAIPNVKNLEYIRATGQWLDISSGAIYESTYLVDSGISLFDLIAIISKPEQLRNGTPQQAK